MEGYFCIVWAFSMDLTKRAVMNYLCYQLLMYVKEPQRIQCWFEMMVFDKE